MGITRTTAQLLLAEAAVRPFRGSIATLGRQHVYFTWAELQQWADRQGVKLMTPRRNDLHRESKLAARGFASDQTVLEGFGFDRVVRMDYSNYEAVEVILDLNADQTPIEWVEQFDVVLNLGTLEHVFHWPNALANVHRLVKPGGRVIHLFPSANCLDHGFFCVSPTLVADYYLANRYELHQVSLLRYRTDDEFSRVDVHDYLQPGPYGCDIGGLDDRVYHTFAIVGRGPDSTCDVVPQQSFYRTQWNDRLATDDRSDEPRSQEGGSRADRLLRRTAGNPPIHWLARQGIDAWRWLRRTYARWRSPVPWRRVASYQ